jgi:hypothetical protein
MDFDKKLILGVALVLVFLLGFPLLPAALKALQSPPAASQDESGTFEAPGAAPAATQAVPSALTAPALTAQNLVGSAWQIDTQYGPVTAYLNAGGVASATHPAFGALSGTWQVNGSALIVTANVLGQTQTIQCAISGTQVLYNGKPVQRLQ